MTKIAKWIRVQVRRIAFLFSSKPSQMHSELPPELSSRLEKLAPKAFSAMQSSKEEGQEVEGTWCRIMDQYLVQKGEGVIIEAASFKADIDRLEELLSDYSEQDMFWEGMVERQSATDRKKYKQEKNHGSRTAELTSLRTLIGKKKARRNQIEGSKGMPGVKSTLDKMPALVLSFLGMMIVEGALTYMAISKLSLVADAAIPLFIVVYSGLVGLACHLFAYFLSKGKKILALGNLIGAFALVTAIVLLRGYGQSEPFDWVLNAANFLFVAICILISVRLHEWREYWLLDSDIAKLESKVDEMNAESDLHLKSLSLLDSEQFNDSIQHAKTSRKQLKDQLLEKKSKLFKCEMKLKGLYANVSAYKEYGLAIIRQAGADGAASN